MTDSNKAKKPAEADEILPSKLTLTTKKAAEFLSCSPRTLIRMADRNLIRCARVTRHRLWPVSELERVIAESLTGEVL